MKTVLVIDDAALAQKLRAGVSQRGTGTAILEGGDSSDAIALYQKSPAAIDLIVMGRQAAQRTGRDLVTQLRENGARNIPVIVVTSSRDELRVLKALKIHGPAAATGRTTQVSLSGFSRRTEKTKQRRETVMRGGFELFALPELIHFLHSVKRTGTLEIIAKDHRAAIDFIEGEVVAADHGELLGPEAFFAILNDVFQGYRFLGDDSRPEPDKGPRAITSSTMALLMEAARRLDDSARCSS